MLLSLVVTRSKTLNKFVKCLAFQIHNQSRVFSYKSSDLNDVSQKTSFVSSQRKMLFRASLIVQVKNQPAIQETLV